MVRGDKARLFDQVFARYLDHATPDTSIFLQTRTSKAQAPERPPLQETFTSQR